MRKLRALTTLILALFLVSLMSGCDFSSDRTENPPPAPTEPEVVTVSALGNCVAVGSSSIQCVDQSTTVPANRLSGGQFEFTNTTTGVFEGSVPFQPGERIQKDGLPIGEYTVRQVANSDTGTSDAEIHNVCLGGTVIQGVCTFT